MTWWISLIFAGCTEKETPTVPAENTEVQEDTAPEGNPPGNDTSLP